MASEKNIGVLKINQLSLAKYNQITPNEGELYVTGDDDIVHIAGNETITGTKTFNGSLYYNGSENIYGSDSSSSTTLEVRGKTNDNTSFASLLLHIPQVHYVRLTQKGDRPGLSIRTGNDGDYEYCSAKTPATSDISNYVATTEFVNNKMAPILMTSNDNFNNRTATGVYYCPANATVKTMSNRPGDNAFTMFVYNYSSIIMQYYFAFTGHYAVRDWQSYNNSWNSWKSITLT